MSTSNERFPEEKEQMQAFLSRKAEIPSGLFTEMPETNPIEKREQLLKQREQLLLEREQKLNEREQLLLEREQLLGKPNDVILRHEIGLGLLSLSQEVAENFHPDN